MCHLSAIYLPPVLQNTLLRYCVTDKPWPWGIYLVIGKAIKILEEVLPAQNKMWPEQKQAPRSFPWVFPAPPSPQSVLQIIGGWKSLCTLSLRCDQFQTVHQSLKVKKWGYMVVRLGTPLGSSWEVPGTRGRCSHILCVCVCAHASPQAGGLTQLLGPFALLLLRNICV